MPARHCAGSPLIRLIWTRRAPLWTRILRNGRRASEIIGRIRALARREAPPRDSFDLNEMIREVLILTQAELSRNGISPRTGLADGLPMVCGDRVQLQQVVLNLI